MVRRIDMTRPRYRLPEGTDPSAAIDAIYGAQQLDRGRGLVRVNKHGELVGGPTGFDGKAGHNYQQNQDPVDRHDPNYDNDTGRAWRHAGGENRPNFDRNQNEINRRK
jgi:hypothetical protein